MKYASCTGSAVQARSNLMPVVLRIPLALCQPQLECSLAFSSFPACHRAVESDYFGTNSQLDDSGKHALSFVFFDQLHMDLPLRASMTELHGTGRYHGREHINERRTTQSDAQISAMSTRPISTSLTGLSFSLPHSCPDILFL